MALFTRLVFTRRMVRFGVFRPGEEDEGSDNDYQEAKADQVELFHCIDRPTFAIARFLIECKDQLGAGSG